MKRISWTLLDIVAAYVTSIVIGILFLFSAPPIGDALWNFLGLADRYDFVYAFTGASALGNTIGLALTLRWQRKELRRLWIVIPITLMFSSAVAVAFLQLGEWVVFHSSLIIDEITTILLCMAGASVISSIGWSLIGWAVSRRRDAKPQSP